MVSMSKSSLSISWCQWNILWILDVYFNWHDFLAKVNFLLTCFEKSSDIVKYWNLWFILLHAKLWFFILFRGQLALIICQWKLPFCWLYRIWYYKVSIFHCNKQPRITSLPSWGLIFKFKNSKWKLVFRLSKMIPKHPRTGIIFPLWQLWTHQTSDSPSILWTHQTFFVDFKCLLTLKLIFKVRFTVLLTFF